MSDVIILTQDLTKVYPGTDFRRRRRAQPRRHAGEIFGLLGPNGAGKTTTAGMLTTRVDPDRGARLRRPASTSSPTRAGQAAPRASSASRTPSTASSRSGRTSTSTAGSSAWTQPESAKRADELLDAFPLSSWAKASVYALSGGMAQRLMVARAIFH